MTPEEENTFRTLKNQLPLVTSKWCKFGIHVWTKWHHGVEAEIRDPTTSTRKRYSLIPMNRYCVHCNDIQNTFRKIAREPRAE